MHKNDSDRLGTDWEVKSILEDGLVTKLEWQSETWCV